MHCHVALVCASARSLSLSLSLSLSRSLALSLSLALALALSPRPSSPPHYSGNCKYKYALVAYWRPANTSIHNFEAHRSSRERPVGQWVSLASAEWDRAVPQYSSHRRRSRSRQAPGWRTRLLRLQRELWRRVRSRSSLVAAALCSWAPSRPEHCASACCSQSVQACSRSCSHSGLRPRRPLVRATAPEPAAAQSSRRPRRTRTLRLPALKTHPLSGSDHSCCRSRAR